MPKQVFTEHPEFLRVSKMVSDAITYVAQRIDCVDALHAFQGTTDRVADDMTKLMLRAYDRDHGSEDKR